MHHPSTLCFKIWIGVFLALVFGLAVINLFSPDRTFSENENRELQTFPEFSMDRLWSAQFTADFDTYMIDQFVFRDGWVSVKTLSERLLGKQSAGNPTTGEVYFAEDGYLMEMFDTIDHARYTRNLDTVAQFSTRVQQELGVKVSTLLIPTATDILADKLPAHAPELDQAALLAQASENIPGFINIRDALSAHADEYIYYRTDHHWTSLGAAYAYAAWREATGRTAPGIDDYQQEVLSDAFYGTTYSKASLYTAQPDTITAMLPRDLGAYTVDYHNEEPPSDSMYAKNYLEVKDKYSVFLNANHPLITIHTSNKNGERLLLLKDSYANTLVQMALRDYEQIFIIDPRYYHLSPTDFARENNVTEILVLYNLKGFSTDTNIFYLST